MIGTIIGDIVGSRFEFANHRSKHFDLFTIECDFTDDTIMTMAVADALQKGKRFDRAFREFGKRYNRPMGGYGASFRQWLDTPGMPAYYSFGNGAAMRVSPVALRFKDKPLEDCLAMAEQTAVVTHNHPEGIKGARCVVHLIWAALNGATTKLAMFAIASKYYEEIDGLSVDDIRQDNIFDESCQVTVPQAIECFLEASSFEDAIRNAVSIGGDSDTIAAITGGIAEAFFGVPFDLQVQARRYLTPEFINILNHEYNGK